MNESLSKKLLEELNKIERAKHTLEIEKKGLEHQIVSLRPSRIYSFTLVFREQAGLKEIRNRQGKTDSDP